jgi:hypothetical protein
MSQKNIEKSIENTDLMLVFEVLEEQALRDLHRFVRSPYFNQREDVILLFDYLRQYFPKKNADKYFLKAKVFEAVYGKEKFDEKKLHYLLSFLLKIIQKYWVVADLEENPIEQQERICKALRQKHLDKLFYKEVNKGHEILEKQPLRNALYHRYKGNFFYEYYEHESSQKRETDVKLQEWSNEIAYGSIINTLRQACLMLSHSRVIKKEYDIPLIKETIQYIENQDFSKLPEIKIYYHLYCMLEGTEAHFHYRQAYNLFINIWKQFSNGEVRNITISLLNFCTKEIRSDVFYIGEGLRIYKLGLTSGILLENDLLGVYTYKNIVTYAVGVKDFDWVFQFIHDYKSKLAADKQETFFTYCLANYYFRTNNYDKAQILLSQVEFKDTLLNFDAKRLLMMMYYENGAFDALDALLTSFKAYVQHHTGVNEQHKLLNINLINIIKKMLNTNLYLKENKQKLREEVIAIPIIAEREWLLARLA